MNYRWRNIVKDYFTFSKRERNGIIIMFFLLAGIVLFFRLVPGKRATINKDAFQQELAQLKISIDSSNSNKRYPQEDYHADYSQPKAYGGYDNFKGELFSFDPNTLDAAGWKRLGIRDKTINTIQNFLAKGYKFRNPSDIQKIYGLRKEDAQRLMPYVQITAHEDNATGSFAASNAAKHMAKPAEKVYTPKIIDINTADTSAFISLPGIGSKLASRIVSFRDKLGGFSSVNQLAETYGLPDSTFQQVKARLQCDNPALRTININTAEVGELRTHPYLKWNIANAIINYRKQHGNYKSIEELKKIDIITDDLFNKIAPYLVL
ncbi:MAG: hypothetical protein JWQ40_3515 [Segetibacter sp.]|nr:hypothetical protein [Segetibacter sp.]